MEPTLMVVGLNYRTAPMAVRERFWIDEHRRYEALLQLSRAEGIDEVIVLSTCNRTEFYLWAKDVTLAANSVMRLLGAEYGLRLQEWKHFYRLLDEAALQHIFRVASCLDSMVVGAPQIVRQLKEAWQQAQKAGATGRFLDAVMQKSLVVSRRVTSETAIGKAAVSIPSHGCRTRAPDFRHARKQENTCDRSGRDERTRSLRSADARRHFYRRD